MWLVYISGSSPMELHNRKTILDRAEILQYRCTWGMGEVRQGSKYILYICREIRDRGLDTAAIPMKWSGPPPLQGGMQAGEGWGPKGPWACTLFSWEELCMPWQIVDSRPMSKEEKV